MGLIYLVLEVNQKELAVVLGVTDRRIRQLINDFGLFQHQTSANAKKKYDLSKCVQEYINYKINTETESKSISKETEQAEHERIKKKISTLRLRKLRGELHDARDVEEFLTNMLISFKKVLIAIPSKAAPLIIGEDDVNKVVDIIEKNIYEALAQLVEYDPIKISGEYTKYTADEDAEDEDDSQNKD